MRYSFHRAFSLIELVIVVVIIGIIAAIAIPRFGSAAQNSQTASIKGSLKILMSAADVYAAEHDGLSPASNPDGSLDANAVNMAARLTANSTAAGATVGPSLPFGPYIRAFPHNPANQRDSFRIDGAPAGANTDGWRYDSVLHVFQADDSPSSAAIQPDSP